MAQLLLLFVVLALQQCSHGSIFRMAPTDLEVTAPTLTLRSLHSEDPNHGLDKHDTYFDEASDNLNPPVKPNQDSEHNIPEDSFQEEAPKGVGWNEAEHLAVTGESSMVVPETTTSTVSLLEQSKPIQPVYNNSMSHTSQRTVGVQLEMSQAPLVNDKLEAGTEYTESTPDSQTTKTPSHNMIEDVKNDKESVAQYWVFGQIIQQSLSGPNHPCVLGLNPCVVSTNPNGTNLLWEDLSRTLAFAWELHVFGSAGLFLLLASGALLGMVGASTLLNPLCGVLGMVNGLLLLTSVLRAVHLLVDPYGTRQLLSRPVLTMLHNLPLPLLHWAQVTLALVTLRGVNLILLPLKLQHPCAVGGLAMLHCTLLLMADLLTPSLSPALPLTLQCLSLCWGLSFCLCILTQSLSHLHSFVRSPIPQWGLSQRIERRVRRITAVCALLGLLCWGFHIYSLLWLYELLGNWRRFGWGWWLGQFWARVLELAWGFSLLALGSWVLWRPGKSQTIRQRRQDGVKGASFWDTVLKNLQTRPFRKSEKDLADLIPNNWAGHQRSRGDINSSMARIYDDQPTSLTLMDMTPEYKNGPASNSSCDSQASLLWQRVNERECILSLIEFDMRPPSPINLSRSIDSALHHGHLLGVGSLFTPPPPPWTHTMDVDFSLGGSGTTPTSHAHVGYRWALESVSRTATPDHFNAREETPQHLEATGGDQTPSLSPYLEHQGEVSQVVSGVSQENDWSSIGSTGDITDL